MTCLCQQILEEFASYGGEFEREGSVYMRSTPRPTLRETLFDIENPAAMLAEQRRLEREAAQRRATAAAWAQRNRDGGERLRLARIAARATARQTQRPAACKVCGGELPVNNLGPVAEHCGQKCRSRAAYIGRTSDGKCARTKCEEMAAPGKSRCQKHLDEAAQYERKKRKQKRAA